MKVYIVEATSGEIHTENRVVEVFTNKALAEQFLSLVKIDAERWNRWGALNDRLEMLSGTLYDPYIQGVDLDYIMYEMDICEKIQTKGRK